MESEKNKKNVKLKTIIAAFAVMFLLYVVIISIALYGFGKHNFLIDATSRFLFFPAAITSKGDFVTIRELNSGVVAVRKFYEGQDFSEMGMRVDFVTTDGQARLKIKEKALLNKLIENKIIKKLAADRDIVISDRIVAQGVEREISQNGNKADIERQIFDLYGWNMEDFKEKIVKPDMYREELEKNMKISDAEFIKAKTKISAAQEELKNGADFSEMAKKYSEGESAKNGGELGWFTADQMMPEVALAAFIIKKGDHSDIIESSLGLHIVQIDDRKTEDNVDKIKIRQVFVRTKSFPDWLAEQEKAIKVFIPLKDYYWDKDAGAVEFAGQEMRDFEKNLNINSAGDISVAF